MDDHVVSARSPRTVVLKRAASAALAEGAIDETDDEDESEDVETSEERDNNNDRVSGTAAKYSEECQRWLNGPTQLEDHKSGKQHKKNVKKKDNDKSGHNATATSNKSKKKKGCQAPASQESSWECGVAPSEVDSEVGHQQVMENSTINWSYPLHPQAYPGMPWPVHPVAFYGPPPVYPSGRGCEFYAFPPPVAPKNWLSSLLAPEQVYPLATEQQSGFQ